MHKTLFNSSIDKLYLTDQQKNAIKKLNNACCEAYGTNDNSMLIAKNKSLRDTINKLNELIALKDAEIQEKDNLIKDKDDSIALLQITKNTEFQKAMARISDRLKAFYLPFKGCEHAQMNVMLGEIMRDYLKKVFRILIQEAHLNLDEDI